MDAAGSHPAQLRVEKLYRRLAARGGVAAVHLQVALGKETRHSPGVGQLPVADEAVVAGVALQVHSQEYLGAVLRRLHRRRLARTHRAPPVHPYQESGRILFSRGVQQRSHKTIVRKVLFERAQQPRGDRFARAVINHPFVVAQQIVPERDPVLRVVSPPGEQRVDQPRAFGFIAVAQEGVELRRGGRQTLYIEPGAAGESAVAGQWRGRLHAVCTKVRRCEAIQRIGARARRNLGPARSNRRRRSRPGGERYKRGKNGTHPPSRMHSS